MSVLTEADKQFFRDELSKANLALQNDIRVLSEELANVKRYFLAVKTENQSLRNELTKVTIQHDDLEQYGRRYAIRVEGLEFTDNKEENKALQAKLIEEFKELDIIIADSDIVRLHRSSKLKHLKVNKNSDETFPSKQCLIKFSNWRAREKFGSFNKKMRNKTKLRVYNDLTTRRLGLLADARTKIRDTFRGMNYSDERVNSLPDTENVFAYVDINSNLAIRSRGEIRRFNTHAELNDILKDVFPQQFAPFGDRPFVASAWGDTHADTERNFGADFANSERSSSRFDQQQFTSRITRSSSRTGTWLAAVPTRVVYSDFSSEELAKWLEDPRHIYAGRGTDIVKEHGYGNPHKINSMTSRAQVIAKYEATLSELSAHKISEIANASQVMCHCVKNRACHVDSLIKFCAINV